MKNSNLIIFVFDDEKILIANFKDFITANGIHVFFSAATYPIRVKYIIEFLFKDLIIEIEFLI